jgi:thiol-disulfide isomerase/thioredoxin
MANKSGKKPDKPVANEPEKKAEKGHANLLDKKIYITVGLVVLVIIGCVIIIGINRLNATPSPALPADNPLNATRLPTLPGDNLLNATPSLALPADTNKTLTAIYFYGNGCVHCEKVKPLIADIQARYPELQIDILEVNDNRENFDTFLTMNRQYGVDSNDWGIPTIFIGKNALVGEIEIKDHFEEYILAEKQRIAAGNTS